MPDENQKNDEEFQQLLYRLADGTLDKSEAELLESLLIDQPERQALYLEYMWLDSSLIELGALAIVLLNSTLVAHEENILFHSAY